MNYCTIGNYASQGKRDAELALCEARGINVYEDPAGYRYAVSEKHIAWHQNVLYKIPDSWKKLF